jgi:hypothetical protein
LTARSPKLLLSPLPGEPVSFHKDQRWLVSHIVNRRMVN